MIYAIVKVTDGNYNIDSEGYTNINNAIVQFHNLCAVLWNDPNTTEACVMITDTNLNVVGGPSGGYKESIRKTQPEPEPEPGEV